MLTELQPDFWRPWEMWYNDGSLLGWMSGVMDRGHVLKRLSFNNTHGNIYVLKTTYISTLKYFSSYHIFMVKSNLIAWKKKDQKVNLGITKPHLNTLDIARWQIQTHTDCAKFMKLRLIKNHDWDQLGIWINCVKNAMTLIHLIALFWNKTQFSRSV